MHEISDTLDAATITIVRQALDGEIDAGEATKRIRYAQRVAAIERYGVKLVSNKPQDIDRVARTLGLEL
jgi:hypothetical protein